jgi:flagellar hook-length control protein FliK
MMVWRGLDLLEMVQLPTAAAGRMIPGPVWQNGLPLALKTRFASEIATHYTQRGGLQTLTVKLNPEHLGRLDIQLQARDSHLEVRFLAANREAEAALRENVKELTDTIQKQSGRFQQVEVRVEVKPNENLANRSRDGESGHSRSDDSQDHSQLDQDSHDEPRGQDAETRRAGTEDPHSGG